MLVTDIPVWHNSPLVDYLSSDYIVRHTDDCDGHPLSVIENLGKYGQLHGEVCVEKQDCYVRDFYHRVIGPMLRALDNAISNIS